MIIINNYVYYNTVGRNQNSLYTLNEPKNQNHGTHSIDRSGNCRLLFAHIRYGHGKNRKFKYGDPKTKQIKKAVSLK